MTFLELSRYDPRSRPGQKNQRVEDAYKRTRERNHVANVKLVPLQGAGGSAGCQSGEIQSTFGQRRNRSTGGSRKGKGADTGGTMEFSWMPSSTQAEAGPIEAEG